MSFLKNLVLVLLGILIGIGSVGIGQLLLHPTVSEGIKILPTETPSPVVVYIAGEVRKPGIYALPDGSRLIDAIRAAGGFKDSADPSVLELAKIIKDGDNFNVPLAEKDLTTSDFPDLVISEDGLANVSDPINSSTDVLDLNLATKAELETLPGIGPTLAQRILDYRDEYGDFYAVKELAEVPGISEALMNELQAYLTVQ